MPLLHDALRVLVDGAASPLLVADSSSVVIAINDAGRELLGDVGFEAVGLKVAHLLRSPASEDLTGPGFHHCALVDGDAKFTCATKCVSEYTCLNLAPLEGSAFGEQHPADGRVRAHSAGALDVRVARNDAFALPTSAAENQMLDQMLGEPVLGPTEDQLEIRLHVLFCDDDPFQAKVMNLLASTNGYDLTHFANGADAIHALRHNDTMAQPFNLVLLDLNMQPMHGLDVLKHIRAFNTSINVIVITANEEDAMVKACILGGANSYIVKPVRDKDVRNMGHFAIEATKAEKLRRRSRVRNAIASVLTTRFAIAFMSLRALKAHGGLIPHEEARSRGLLVQCDTYEDVASFIRTHPTAFFSHQWLSREHPDPDGLQFQLMVDASRRLCEIEGVSEDALFVWVDFSSIPQKNKFMQRLSISTLGVYASLCKFFVVVAPQALQRDSNVRCDAATYRRRGWCRLEQWAHLTAAGTSNMYVIERAGELQAISNRDEWVDDSIRVFDGEFTWEEDKTQLVDVVLGLWSLTLVASAAGLAHVAPIVAKVDKSKSEVFPFEHFADLVQMLEIEIAAHYGARAQPQGSALEPAIATSPQLLVAPRSPTRRQRVNTYANVPIGMAWLSPTSELHVMAAELVEFRRLFHRVVRTLDHGTSALEQVTQSMLMLAMPLDREGACDALIQLNKDPRGPPLGFRDYCRVMSKLRRGLLSVSPGGRSPALRGSLESTRMGAEAMVSGINEAMHAMAVRDGRELTPMPGVLRAGLRAKPPLSASPT